MLSWQLILSLPNVGWKQIWEGLGLLWTLASHVFHSERPCFTHILYKSVRTKMVNEILHGVHVIWRHVMERYTVIAAASKTLAKINFKKDQHYIYIYNNHLYLYMYWILSTSSPLFASSLGKRPHYIKMEGEGQSYSTLVLEEFDSEINAFTWNSRTSQTRVEGVISARY